MFLCVYIKSDTVLNYCICPRILCPEHDQMCFLKGHSASTFSKLSYVCIYNKAQLLVVTVISYMCIRDQKIY